MQIVINIPKEIYDYIHNEHIALRVCDAHQVASAIANGIVLPEHHGRLIDADRLQEVFERNVVGADAYSDLFKNVPTVLEGSD